MIGLGCTAFLIGCAGMAEGYGNVKQVVISIALIGIGIVLMRLGNEKNDYSRTDSDNVLDRLRFLPR